MQTWISASAAAQAAATSIAGSKAKRSVISSPVFTYRTLVQLRTEIPPKQTSGRLSSKANQMLPPAPD